MADIIFPSLVKYIGFRHGSFDLIEFVGCPMSLMEGILGNLKIWSCNLYSSTCGEVYQKIVFPLDLLMGGTWVEDMTVEGITSLEDTSILGDTILEGK